MGPQQAGSPRPEGLTGTGPWPPANLGRFRARPPPSPRPFRALDLALLTASGPRNRITPISRNAPVVERGGGETQIGVGTYGGSPSGEITKGQSFCSGSFLSVCSLSPSTIPLLLRCSFHSSPAFRKRGEISCLETTTIIVNESLF